ncbi:hypothetical protein D3C78_1633750 [compost metagenome]
MAWAELTWRSARAVSSGKPSTTPPAVTSSGSRSRRRGRGWRSRSRIAAANSPAMLARARVRKIGSKLSTATRVAGSEPLKMRMPRKPLSQPFMCVTCGAMESSMAFGLSARQ